MTELEPDRPYLGWTGTLRTTAPAQQIHEVFEFVLDDCELEIDAVQAASDCDRRPRQRRHEIEPAQAAAAELLPPSRRAGDGASSPPLAPSLEVETPDAGRSRDPRRLRLPPPAPPRRGSSSKRSIASSTWSANW